MQRLKIAILPYLLLLSIVLIFSCKDVAATQTAGNTRVALVIGNSHYRKLDSLKNPVNDASDVAAALKDLGFTVILSLDADRELMYKAINRFEGLLSPKTDGLFYFAGHGAQVNGVNYLLPVDADVSLLSDLPGESVAVNRILGRMEASGSAVNIIILDACRNNPSFKGSSRSGGGKGLARMKAPLGSFIGYATAPGHTAEENEKERNGLYTKYLLKYIGIPGLTINQVFTKTRAGVVLESDRAQIPWDSSSLLNDYYLAGEPTQHPETIVTQAAIANTKIEVLHNLSFSKNKNSLVVQYGGAKLIYYFDEKISAKNLPSLMLRGPVLIAIGASMVIVLFVGVLFFGPNAASLLEGPGIALGVIAMLITLPIINDLQVNSFTIKSNHSVLLNLSRQVREVNISGSGELTVTGPGNKLTMKLDQNGNLLDATLE